MYNEKVHPIGLEFPMSVLYVEDRKEYRDVLGKDLENFFRESFVDITYTTDEPFKVTQVNSSEKAKKILQEKPNQFQLLVVDLHLGTSNDYEGFDVIEYIIEQGIYLPWMIYAEKEESKVKNIAKRLKKCLNREDIDELECIYIGKNIESSRYDFDAYASKPRIDLSNAFKKLLFDRVFVTAKTTGKYFSICNLSDCDYYQCQTGGESCDSIFQKIPPLIEKSIKPRPDFYFVGGDITRKESEENSSLYIFDMFLPELMKFKTFSLRNMPYGRLDRVLIVPENRCKICNFDSRANAYMLPSLLKKSCTGHEHLLYLRSLQDSLKFISFEYFPLLNAIFLIINMNGGDETDEISFLTFSVREIDFAIKTIQNFKDYISPEIYNRCAKIIFCHFDIFQSGLNQRFCDHLIKEKFLVLIYGHSDLNNKTNFDSFKPEDIVKWEDANKIPRIYCGSLNIARCVNPWFTILNIIIDTEGPDNFNFSFIEYKIHYFDPKIKEWKSLENQKSIEINDKIFNTLSAYIDFNYSGKNIRIKKIPIHRKSQDFPIWWDSQVLDNEKFYDQIGEFISFLHGAIVLTLSIKTYLKEIKYNEYLKNYLDLGGLFEKYRSSSPGINSDDNLTQLKAKYIQLIQNVKRDKIYEQMLQNKEI